MSIKKEPLVIVYILLYSSFIEPFEPFAYIDVVFLNEIDIWNYIEKKYYAMIKDIADNIEKVEIDRWGVYVYLNTNNKKFNCIKYEIYRRVAL